MGHLGGIGRLAGVAVLAVAVTSCGDDGSSDAVDADKVGNEGADDGGPDAPAGDLPARSDLLPVETLTETFVDDGRPTPSASGGVREEIRTLETDLYVPEGDGPFPLLVHAHGFDGNAGKYVELLTAWAEAGYVVAAPTFPATNDLGETRSVFSDYESQPADVALVIDEVLALSAGDHPVLAGRVDGDRIGVSGHSLGGVTMYGLAFNTCCRDDRIGAVVVMSGEPLDLDGSDAFDTGTPLMVMAATDDPIVDYDAAAAPYHEATAPKYLVTMEGDQHFEQYEDVSSPHDQMVVAVTLAFWDAHLGDDPDAADRMVAAADAAPLAALLAEP